MPAINSENVASWNQLFAEVGADCPRVGRQVASGKHEGKTGIVERHQRDKFLPETRYAYNEASGHLRDAAGRYGWICLINTGTEKFWVKADLVTVKG